ncbi:uncharacterized protein LOC135097756 isoform X4 [Scylla paramamosain]|uniref:uncharacterized protein LOC135097756 isoform X4 n=1 Tax=Scylla paramamosain TaxID=85552 RepID=UPI00308345E7
MPDSGVILFHLYHQDQDQDNSSLVFTTTLHRSLVLFANFPSNSPPRRPPPVPQFPASMVDPCGSSLVVKASDGKMVMVTLPNPLQENLEDVIEVQGVGQGQKVTCQSYVTFPQMQAADVTSRQCTAGAARGTAGGGPVQHLIPPCPLP